ncbi:hypothetical protein TNCV_2492271 [Trichonephila clavipes]|nr:hypothetical protein TNCV_2492271 [Trichonephila clavipes]
MVRQWVQHFSDGWTNVHDEAQSVRSSVVNDGPQASSKVLVEKKDVSTSGPGNLMVKDLGPACREFEPSAAENPSFQGD